MINILKPSELAKALDVSCASITMAVKNGTLDWDSNKCIDITSLKNKTWIEKQKQKGRTFDINRIYNNPDFYKNKLPSKQTTRIPKTVQIEGDASTEIEDKKRKGKSAVILDDDGDDLYSRKLKLEIEKLENTNRKDALQIAKLEGDLLPVECVEKIFLWSVNDMKKTYEQDIDNLINIFNKKLGGTQKDYMEMKKSAMESLSETGNVYKDNLISGLKNQIKEYQEVRGRGERK